MTKIFTFKFKKENISQKNFFEYFWIHIKHVIENIIKKNES